ncbi:MAG: hypothetical protein CO030_03030 [Candidatus Magasanikbacteria bacterium CG_4_9_14_0_2_um_filter_42_11]|uniref:Uncharacterized protein n=1 Tax=Candidatus Magasanikbacteria bacterium CG_4_9_14_0_2_um_filter_42_11 TaxID=1974643 RepID=A0A2M8F9L6_9BACT|nr:MAG: hypothetical protein COY70_03415 [Candidatus Magasanikbacteria bacterium CG_4_10_14_0_8_um_filter_42_12]PJC52398.1 MAG: hypothetical protein CO030_03030 [Candidatus Magasanikbacteria bacterium CG_4_9_14_0_2_um_filter_42_11]
MPWNGVGVTSLLPLQRHGTYVMSCVHWFPSGETLISLPKPRQKESIKKEVFCQYFPHIVPT